MKVEVEITPVSSIDQTLELVEVIEGFSATRLGVSDVVLFRDVYSTMTICAQHTNRVLIGPLVTNPYLRHPVPTAASFATMNEISSGRMFLGIGVGSGISQLGFSQSNPAGILEEFILVFKRLLEGGKVDFDGDYFSLSNVALPHELTAKIPIVIGTRSEQVCKLAGKVADGVVIGAREISDRALSEYVNWINEGARSSDRRLDEIEIAPRVTVCISNERDAALGSVVLYTAHYSTLGRFDESLMGKKEYESIKHLANQASGWYFEPDVMYPEELNTIVTPRLIDKFAIAGTPADCLNKFQTIKNLGFESVSINIAAVRRPGTSLHEGTMETLQGLQTIMPEILLI